MALIDFLRRHPIHILTERHEYIPPHYPNAVIDVTGAKPRTVHFVARNAQRYTGIRRPSTAPMEVVEEEESEHEDNCEPGAPCACRSLSAKRARDSSEEKLDVVHPIIDLCDDRWRTKRQRLVGVELNPGPPHSISLSRIPLMPSPITPPPSPKHAVELPDIQFDFECHYACYDAKEAHFVGRYPDAARVNAVMKALSCPRVPAYRRYVYLDNSARPPVTIVVETPVTKVSRPPTGKKTNAHCNCHPPSAPLVGIELNPGPGRQCPKCPMCLVRRHSRPINARPWQYVVCNRCWNGMGEKVGEEGNAVNNVVSVLMQSGAFDAEE
jgi:hypothetical protein